MGSNVYGVVLAGGIGSRMGNIEKPKQFMEIGGKPIIVHTIEELLEEIKKYPSDQVYCIGGDSVYKQLLPYCDTAHVTKIDFAYEADSYFPNLDEMPEWKVTAESDEQTYFDLEYTFVKYERVK